MSPKQRELARHALGLPNERGQSYRNRYYAGPGHHAYEHWRAMIEAGDADRQARGASDLFWLTDKGARAALDKGERLCPEDFPAPASAGGRQ
jgi:hypothetical protein